MKKTRYSFNKKAWLIIFVFLLSSPLFFGISEGGPTYDLRVNLGPAGNVPAGAQWSYDGGANWIASGITKTKLDPGAYTISFKEVEGYIAPEPYPFTLSKNETPLTPSPAERFDYQSIPVGTITDKESWPEWPDNSTTADINPPSTLTSIGRDVVSWLSFSAATDHPNFLQTSFNFLAQLPPDQDGNVKFKAFTPAISDSDTFYFVEANNRENISSYSQFSNISVFLKDQSVFKEYKDAWLSLTGHVDSFANERFFRVGSEDVSYNNWKTFIRGDKTNLKFEFADTGHAPSQIMWAEDPWFKFFLSDYPQNIWPEDTIYAFLSTNQGTLQGLEVKQGLSPSATRKWLFMPNPAFRQSIYFEVKRAINDLKYYRMTVMDGPFSIRDVQDGAGNWVRVAVGTSGLGTKQSAKLPNAWYDQGVPGIPTPSDSPLATDTKNRVFGLYALEVTSPDVPATRWSVSSVHFDRDFGSVHSVIKSPETISSGQRQLHFLIGDNYTSPKREESGKPIR